MSVSEEYIDLFERYSQQQLSDKEVLEFDARLAYDIDFSQQFEQYKQIEEGIRDHYRNEMKRRFLFIDEEMDHKSNEKHKVKKKWIVFVAAAAVLVIIFSVYKSNQKSELTQLALNYWPAEPGLPVKMSSKATYDDAMNAYKLGEFDKASALLKTIPSDTSIYFQGVIAFEIDDYKKASGYFRKIEENSSYHDEAQFRLAIACLAAGELRMAREILHLQVDQQTEFASASKELLTKI